MSVKELILGDAPIKLKVSRHNDKIILEMRDIKPIAGLVLDRNQAHLLMLFLQEHLK